MKYIFYTDGAATIKKINNVYTREAGGWSFVMLNDNNEILDKAYGGAPLATNNAMELYAILCALRHYWSFGETGGTVEICSDSAYCINIFTNWIDNWKKNGWTRGKKHEPIENLEIIKEIDKVMTGINKRFCRIEWAKVKGHSTNEFNNYADELAVKGKLMAAEQKRIIGYRGEEESLLTI